MIQKIFIIRQKHSVESNTHIKQAVKGSRGNAMSIIIFSLAIMVVFLVIFMTLADYGLYSMKRRQIAKALDFAVTSTRFEFKIDENRLGISQGINETDGRTLVNIKLDEQNADNAFFSTFEENCGIKKDDIFDRLLVCITIPQNDGSIKYIIKKGSSRFEGYVSKPDKLEAIINQYIDSQFELEYQDSDNQTIYVNGNPKTNQFLVRPYYMVFIRDFEIDGLFKKRSATFISFASSKISRKLN